MLAWFPAIPVLWLLLTAAGLDLEDARGLQVAGEVVLVMMALEGRAQVEPHLLAANLRQLRPRMPYQFRAHRAPTRQAGARPNGAAAQVEGRKPADLAWMGDHLFGEAVGAVPGEELLLAT